MHIVYFILTNLRALNTRLTSPPPPTEYGGAWKPLHYFARRFFAPASLIAAFDEKSGNLSVYSQSSLDTTLEDHLVVRVYAWASFTNYTYTDSAAVSVLPHASHLVYRQGLDAILRAPSCVYKVNYVR